MEPKKFRHVSIGSLAIRVVASNEWRAFKHNKGLLLSMFMDPLITYGLLVLALNTNLGSVDVEGVVLTYKQYALTGVMTYFMTTQMSQAMYRATVDKEYGLLALKFLNGIQPWQYLIGMSVFPIIGLVFQCAVLVVLGLLTDGIYQIGLFLLTLPVVIIALEFWAFLGILLSTMISTYAKRDIVMTLLFRPIFFAAPTLYVMTDKLPVLIKILVFINPLTYQLEAIRTIAIGIFNVKPIIIVIILTIVMMYFTQIALKNLKLTLSER